MRVLVCGGRDYKNRAVIRKALAEIKPTVLIHGVCRGADILAGEIAKELGVEMIEEYPADWENIGMAAGFRRNQQMLDMGKPDLVVAFPGGKGTADMVRRARKAGVKVVFPVKET